MRMASLLLGSAVLAISTALQAQDIAVDENTLFADSSSLADSAAVTQGPAASASGAEAKSLGVSGSLLCLIQGSASRDFFASPDADSTGLYGAVVGDVVLDARLQRGFKAYLDFEVAYLPSQADAGSDSATSWRVPEAFLDANIAHRAYFRFGKQVLQWGRGYFFNPTDLVNTDRNSFFRRVGNREGVFGAKVHVPFGTVWNLYGFADAQGVGRIDSVAGAFRIERLLGGTEMSAMIWDRGGGPPVYGADVSTRFLGLDATGELALHPEFTKRTLSTAGGFPSLRTETETWTPRASAGLGRSFRVSGIKDRLTTVAEYYYNGPGSRNDRMGLKALLPLLGGTSGASSSATALAAQGLYQANSISRNYAAFFATFSRFMRSDITLSFNAIGNLDQSCALLSGGIAYRDLNDFGLSLNVNGFVGPEDTEYTWSGQAAQAQLIAEAAF
ncbi:MAG: hypothetical protein ABIW76_24335 [Fibrobacteria bacterium]